MHTTMLLAVMAFAWAIVAYWARPHVVAAIALLLAGCASTQPATVTVTPAAPAPIAAGECDYPNPAPVRPPADFAKMSPEAQETLALRLMAEKDRRTTRIEGWRNICRASLKAHGITTRKGQRRPS